MQHSLHTRGWVRELAAETLGIAYVLPPPEEKMDFEMRDLKCAMGATPEAARCLL